VILDCVAWYYALPHSIHVGKEALENCDGKASARVKQTEMELLVHHLDVEGTWRTAMWPEVLAEAQRGGVPADQVSLAVVWDNGLNSQSCQI
jgi:hypothetical protein